jgi:hypothetical protein
MEPGQYNHLRCRNLMRSYARKAELTSILRYFYRIFGLFQKPFFDGNFAVASYLSQKRIIDPGFLLLQ